MAVEERDMTREELFAGLAKRADLFERKAPRKRRPRLGDPGMVSDKQDANIICLWMWQLRKQSRMSQAAFADKIGVPESTYIKWEARGVKWARNAADEKNLEPPDSTWPALPYLLRVFRTMGEHPFDVDGQVRRDWLIDVLQGPSLEKLIGDDRFMRRTG